MDEFLHRRDGGAVHNFHPAGNDSLTDNAGDAFA